MDTTLIRIGGTLLLAVTCMGLGCSGSPAPTPPSTGSNAPPVLPSNRPTESTTTQASDNAAATAKSDPWRVPPNCPLTSDGYVDYMAPIYERAREGVTLENNAAVLLWQAFGPEPIPEDKREDYFAGIGMDVPPTAGDYFVTLEDFARRPENARRYGDVSEERLNAMRKRAARAPWTPSQFPLIHDWLTANSEPLKLVVQASTRSRYYVPQLPGKSTAIVHNLIPGARERRNTAYSLVARGMRSLASGDVESAWADVIACHRLARLWGEDRTLIQAVFSIAVDDVANVAVRYLASHTPLTSATAGRIERDIRNLSPLPPISERLDEDDRYMCVDAIARMKREGLGDIGALFGHERDTSLVARFGDYLIDWETVAQVAVQQYDEVVEVAEMRTHAQRKPLIAPLEEELATFQDFDWESESALDELLQGRLRSKTGGKLGEFLALCYLRDVPAVMRVEIRHQTHLDFARLALALAAYQADHGGSPVRLDDLVPDYLPEISPDHFSGEPLKYRKQPGGYVLYSVGPNLQDDEANDHTSRRGGDDIVVRVPSED